MSVLPRQIIRIRIRISSIVARINSRLIILVAHHRGLTLNFGSDPIGDRSRTSLSEKEGARGGEERLRTTSWIGGNRKRAVKVDQEED